MVHGRGNAACLVWYPGATIVVAIRDLDGIGGEKRQLANEHTPSLAIRECDRIRINKLRGWRLTHIPACFHSTRRAAIIEFYKGRLQVRLECGYPFGRILGGLPVNADGGLARIVRQILDRMCRRSLAT